MKSYMVYLKKLNLGNLNRSSFFLSSFIISYEKNPHIKIHAAEAKLNL